MQELSFIYAVSSVVASSLDAYRAAEYIADLLTQIAGISGVCFGGLGITAGKTTDPRGAVARADIAASDGQWGEVRIWFDGQRVAVESPMELARFVGQQVGLLLARAYSTARIKNVQSEIDNMRDDPETRKIFHRASGILASEQRLTETHADAVQQFDSQRTGRPVRYTADVIVTASGFADGAPPRVRTSA